MVLLDRGVLVVHVQARGDPVGDDPGAEPSRGRVRALAEQVAVEDQPDLVGAADVQVVADHLLEEHPPRHGPVQHLGQRELGLQDRDVVAVPGGPVGVGERVRQDRQPLVQQRLDLSGPSRSQICCSPAGSSTVANALSSGVNPIPALAAWCWAQWLPLMHSLAL